MKSISRLFSIVAAGALAGALALPSPVQAQGAPREGSLEFILPISYSPSTSFNGQGGSSAELNSTLGFGFGLGYNVNNHLQLGGTVNWGYRNYIATTTNNNGTTSQGSGQLSSSTIGFNAIYYFMSSGLTPFLSAGIGSTWVDTGIPNGLPQTGCWYDPWYGYVCNSYTPTKSQTAVSYTGGAGVRFEVSRAFSVQASYNKAWIELTKGTPEVDSWRVDLVWRM
ncbi:MAG TPA: outer membrane beta-barrel protein [Burkholderiales bacterium]